MVSMWCHDSSHPITNEHTRNNSGRYDGIRVLSPYVVVRWRILMGVAGLVLLAGIIFFVLIVLSVLPWLDPDDEEDD